MSDAAEAYELRRPPTQAITCLNCGANVASRWCGDCGQRAETQRLTLRRLVREVPHGILHVDRGLVPTVRALLGNPGKVVADYLAGKRVRYFNPLTLLVISAGVCGAAWAVFPFRQDLFLTLVPLARDTVFAWLAALWLKVVGATQLAFLLVQAGALYTAWAVRLHKALVEEGKAPPLRRISWFWLLLPHDGQRLAADPRHVLYSEAIVAAAFVTSISLLITAMFAPLFAAAQTTRQYEILIIVSGVLSAYPPLHLLHLLRTCSPAGHKGWGLAVSNALLTGIFTPCGFLLYMLLLQYLKDVGP
jgi:hypothetical protein